MLDFLKGMMFFVIAAAAIVLAVAAMHGLIDWSAGGTMPPPPLPTDGLNSIQMKNELRAERERRALQKCWEALKRVDSFDEYVYFVWVRERPELVSHDFPLRWTVELNVHGDFDQLEPDEQQRCARQWAETCVRSIEPAEGDGLTVIVTDGHVRLIKIDGDVTPLDAPPAKVRAI